MMATFTVKKCPIRPPSHPPAPPETVILPAGHQRFPSSRPLPTEIILDRDAIITLRDGTKIRADIYRPNLPPKVPAIIMWGPYGKSGTSGGFNLAGIPFRAGIPSSKLSGYEVFEGLDPAEWVPRGYAIVNVDPRGIGDSEGDAWWWGSGEGRDGADAVNFVANLDWCNGSVGTAGNSWLAMSQYFIAAEKPGALKCIAPLEGCGDVVREDFFRGGVDHTAFMRAIASTLSGRQMQEDVPATWAESEVSNEYWEDKRAKFVKIDVPAYVLASYSSKLHTVGSFRCFEEIRHDKKWLTVHATQEWYDLYTNERTADLQRFFDRYLKGIENAWESTPHVRYSYLRFNKPAITGHAISDLPWKLPSARKHKLYLNPDQTMSTASAKSALAANLSYEANSNTATMDFTYTFPKRTTIAGPSCLTVNLSAPSATDLDVYVQLRKASHDGGLLESYNIPLSDLGVASPEMVPDTNIMKHLGPSGTLRASRRHISEEKSTPWWKTLSNVKIEPVPQGEIVKLEIGIWPTGIAFEEGEKLVVRIAGHELVLPEFEHLKNLFMNRNVGQHVLWFGDERVNCLEFWEVDV